MSFEEFLSASASVERALAYWSGGSGGTEGICMLC